MNSAPDHHAGSLSRALWPAPRLGEAIAALARATGLPTAAKRTAVPPPDLDADSLGAWIEAAAEQGGWQASSVSFALDELTALLTQAPPLIVRIKSNGDDRFLAIASANRGSVTVVGPDLRSHRLTMDAISGELRRPAEAQIAPGIDRIVGGMELDAARAVRARRALVADRLKAARFRGAWTLRVPAGAPIREEVSELGVRSRIIGLSAAHLLQYLLFILSWWLLGRGVLNGHLDAGWLTGWSLLLVSLIPLRLLTTWLQGAVAVTAGAWLRRRLLRGSLRVEREQIRRQGAGQFFGLLVESAAVESLALSGGIGALFAFLELALAAFVLWAGGGILLGVLLICWGALAVRLAVAYLRRRRQWTNERLVMTHQLLESMLGHRTRLAQQPMEQWHPQEDMALSAYLESGNAMDRAGLWLTAIVPRGWLAVALVALAPAIAARTPAERIAVSVGGILLAYRSLRRLSAGLTNLGGAAISAEMLGPVLKAARRAEPAPDPSVVVPGHKPVSDAVAVQARELRFGYPQQPEPVLQGCTFNIARGARLLLEGPSGAGKSTLASILAGLERAESGLLLVDGLDRSVLGASGWRKRVVLAPQAHDNYLIGGSLAFNLLMGRRWPAEKADLMEAEEVCRELGLGDLLDRLPGGLHQMVGETGWQLSQGERTRVFLARALLQRPEVLILDESFGALDPENVDRAARCVLKRAPTVLAIAHA